MKFRPKKLRDQVIVITGASSGIGLATARLAARKGARVVLASRNEPELKCICDEIRLEGGEAVYVGADVADREAVNRVAAAAIRTFGGFDTWVNNAAVSMFARIMEGDLENERRVFDVNFWGVVHGSQAALDYLRNRGGTLINIGSVLSNRAIPLQGVYSASKHAVRAFSDALRMEVEKQKLPVNVILLKPATIDTPFPHHARNYMDVKASLPPPYYAPEVVARTVLRCAQQKHRDVIVGGLGGVGLIWMQKLAPGWSDWALRKTMFRLQRNEAAPPLEEDALYEPPACEGEIRGGYPGHVARTSLFTFSYLHPYVSLLTMAGFLAGIALVLGRRKSPRDGPRFG